jgi:hypothetical protein
MGAVLMALNRNPRTGRPATLCACGVWNDWHKEKDPAVYAKRFSKPRQCYACGRQILDAFKPNPKRVFPSQVMLDGQRQLFNITSDSD